MRDSLYWDDFKLRINETVDCISKDKKIPVRRVAVFITDRCNFSCGYCNHENKKTTLSKNKFMEVLEQYGETAIIHITGGEPSVVPWLYPLLNEYKDKYRFNLNTNAFVVPPFQAVKRLKISLDHYDSGKWNCLVGRHGAFKLVVDNIKESSKHTTVSITYTMTRDNYMNIPRFIRFAKNEFPDVYQQRA